MSPLAAVAERYVASFNETDPDRRRAAIESLYTADARYVDPHQDLTGPDEIEQFVAGTQARFPGVVFAVHGPVDEHHGVARFQWSATPAGAPEPAYIGFDVLVTEDPRVRRVYGFLDQAPAA